MNHPALDHCLTVVDQAVALRTYDLWRRAYYRGLVTAAELSRFLVRFDRETADLGNPTRTFPNPWRTNHE